MAVYTHVGSEDVVRFLRKYDVGELTAFKGIAEGVENSNYFVSTTEGRFFLTIYESRVDPGDLPFFHALLDHLHQRGQKVPRFINDNDGKWLQNLVGKPACLIEFLDGVSANIPTVAQAKAVGAALGAMHNCLSDFDATRTNNFGQSHWREFAAQLSASDLDGIQSGLAARIASELDFLDAYWPNNLPLSAVHADLFPDNVLLINAEVTGLIDFYFSCTDITAYDVAITHAAWSFSNSGEEYFAEVGNALLAGYRQSAAPTLPDRATMKILSRGACLRFLLTRCYDWLNSPANALVSLKDPLAFLRRLDFYSQDTDIF